MRYFAKSTIPICQGLILFLLACGTATATPAVTPAPASPAPAGAVRTAEAITRNTTPAPAPTPVPTEPATRQAAAAAVPTPIPTPALLPPPAGKPGGALRVVGFAGSAHRDVHQTVQEAVTSLGPGLAYSRLLRLRSSEEIDQPNLVLECDLCLDWRLTPDFAYEFQLRPEVRWHNVAPVYGRPLVAEDVVFSYQRLRTEGWPNAQLFNSIGAMEATGPHSLRVELATADADAILSLADGHSKIVAREVVEQYGDLRDSPVVGTGPWLWRETQEGAGTNLDRNPDYFEEGLPFLDRLEIRVMDHEGAGQPVYQDALTAFRTGVLDVVPLQPAQWRTLMETRPNLSSAVSRQAGTGVMLAMNVQSPAFSRLEVRRAVLKSIDPWDNLDTLWAGQGFVSVGIPVQSPDWLLSRAEIRGGHLADPGNARELLAESGWPAPVEIELTVRTERYGDIYLDLEDRLVRDLRAVGFNPRVRRLNPIQFMETVVGRKDYELALGVMPPTSTTNTFLAALLHSGGRWNIAAHQDRELDRMIEAQAAEFDPARRRSQLLDIQRHVLNQAYLFSPVSGSSRWVFSPKLKGFSPSTALSEYIYWSRAWLER